MRLAPGRTPRHAAPRSRRRGGFAGLLALALVGGVLSAPVLGALEAGPAAAAPAISATGSFTSVIGSGLTSVSDHPQAAGDLMTVVAEEDMEGPTVTGVSGGGVTTWQQAVAYNGVGEPRVMDIWYGVATSTSSSTINFTWSSSFTGHNAEYEVQEFTIGAGTDSIWALDTTGHAESPMGTAIDYPSLTPAAAGELYFGFADMPSTPSAGSTPGFVYTTTTDSNQVAWNTDVGAGAVQPTSSQGASDLSSSIGALFSASVAPSPAVTSVSPTGGSIAGGNTVTVNGNNLTGATAVDFGTHAGSNVVVNGGGTSLTVKAPAQSAGTVDVTVTSPAGTSAISSADKYTYEGAPAITAITPDSGSGSGGSTVTITGTSLSGITAVAFGANAGTNIAVNNAGTSLTVTTPAGKVGNVSVSVTSPGGTSGTLPFTYVAYWMVGSDGGVFSFGGAPFFGSLPYDHVTVNDIVAVVPTHDGGGYWMIGRDGGVFAFGDAGFVGSIPGLPGSPHVNDIVGAVPTASGKGYWMVGADGGVFAFGDAGFVGSIPGLPGSPKVSDITAVVPTSTGKGYWMIGRDGGVFAFGDAGFVGSIPGLHAKVDNIVGAVPTASGKGYWMVGADGGVFAFGDATFVGSIPGLPGSPRVNDVVGVVATPDNQGYWMVGSDGGVFAFGDATFVGSIPGLHVSVHNIVGFAPQ